MALPLINQHLHEECLSTQVGEQTEEEDTEKYDNNLSQDSLSATVNEDPCNRWGTTSDLQTEEESTEHVITWDRLSLRAYMLTHSIKGNKKMPSRKPFSGEILTVDSPSDATVKFGIRRLDNRAVMTFRDKNSVIRFINEDETGRFIQEKDYPMGTMRLDTIALGLASWNITDENTELPIPLGEEVIRDNVLKYLDPAELDFIYDKINEINPILSGREERKKS